MINIVCKSCQVEYYPEKNGVFIIEMFLDPPQPYKVYAADLWKCPKCGHETVKGFSTGIAHHEEAFEAILEEAQARDPIYVYERA